ncbi:MAG: type VI secretion system baseplate subunit TssF [Rubrivivax sp.]|nr:MAG: type VI secretion system baseplate subunit TssF [Rubrivivax sp.]
MDPRLLRYYNQELQHLREMGAEFAQQFPKIAGRLGIDGIEVNDPYVERLLEGFAFLTARVQLKLDAEFPRFTQRLLEIVHPHFLAPTPAMLIAQLQPDLGDANLARGVKVPRGSAMRSTQQGKDETPCQFRTAHDVVLWPLEITSVEYFSYAADLPLSTLAVGRKVKGGLRLKLRTTAGVNFSQLALNDLRLHFSGSDDIAYKLHERVLGSTIGALITPGNKSGQHTYLPASTVQAVGFDDEHALLPLSLRGFSGYRLLQEYFAFPQRFLFFDLQGVGDALRQQGGTEAEIVLLFDRADASLESVVDASNLALNCTPAINLFERRCDRIHVTPTQNDYHVLVDRTRPMDFEVYDLIEVNGYGVGIDSERRFLPFYAAFHTEDSRHNAYYAVQREPRLLSTTQQRNGARSSYVGTEMYISLVDPREAPYPGDLRQLGLSAVCTNRDLPLLLPVGLGHSDLTLDDSAPVKAIRVIKGPSKPLSALRDGGIAWKFVNQLSLNYLSLLDTDAHQGAAALRELLTLYADNGDGGMLKQIEGLRSVSTAPIVRRLPMPGPITFGRGLAINLEVDEMAFQGLSAFLFGSVLENFFARHVSINAFTETTLRSQSRGDIKRWVPRVGTRAII